MWLWFSWFVDCLVWILNCFGLNPWTWSWVNWLSFWYSVAQSQPKPQPPPPPPQPFVVFPPSPPSSFWGIETTYQSPSPRVATSEPPEVYLQTHITALPPAPPNWSQSLAEATTTMADPKCKLRSPFMEIPVPDSSAEFNQIEKMFEGIDNLQMVRLHRVVNPELWKRFDQTRKGLLASKSTDINLLSALGLSDEEIAQKLGEALTFNHAKSPYCDNVVLLFHGTRSGENILGILSEGLDDRLASTLGVFGPGIYFSDCPKKARQYDTTGELLIFAVMLGDCLAVDKEGYDALLNWGQREPQKPPTQRRNLADRFFTSIVGRRRLSTTTGPTNSSTAQRGPNEYVIFNRALCYPMYILTYTDTPSYEPSTSTLTPEGQDFEIARLLLPAFAWVDRDTMTTTEAKSPFYASTIFQAMTTEEPGESDTDTDTDATATDNSNRHQDESESGVEGGNEACLICAVRYPLGDIEPWQTFPCNPLHKICTTCATTLRTTGTTMSGQTHSFIKCPVCHTVFTSTPESGLALTVVPPIPIGECPTGAMTVGQLLETPEGYEGIGSIAINYWIPPGATHGPTLNRTAVLPNTPEGRTVLELLRIAWDHRLTFRIGSSAKTGRTNTLVWNIDHKTRLNGGEAAHGYPDPTYLMRVRQQLAGYGIRASDEDDGDRDPGADTDTEEGEPVEILY